MTSSLVSIIIPTYNRAHLIGETLDSVLAQTYTNWECIIVDDGSTDHTVEVLKGYLQKDSRFQYHHRPNDRPKGANACRNYGFELSKGEYIQFLDSDDVLADFCFANRLTIFKDSKVDFVVANTSKFQGVFFDNKTINIDPKNNSIDNYRLLFMSYKLPWTIMSVLWKRSIIQDFSMDETLSRFQDVDFNIRVLISKKYTFKRLYEIDNYYRCSENEKINNANEYEAKVVVSFFKLLHKFGEKEFLDYTTKVAFRRFCYIISRDFIYFSESRNNIKKSEFLFLMKKYKLLNYKDLLIFKTMELYSFLNIFSKKGFGFHRFRKFSNKYYDQILN